MAPAKIFISLRYENKHDRLIFKFSLNASLTQTQLVIVGKQSVGKSSLLQSLTDIPFPVSEELCTRFATRIISRRTVPGTPDQIKVFIEKGEVDPFGDSKDDDQTSQLDFPEDQKSMSAQYFRDLVDKACRKTVLESFIIALIYDRQAQLWAYRMGKAEAVTFLAKS